MKKYIVFVSVLWVALCSLKSADAMVMAPDPQPDTPLTYTWSAGDLYDLDHGSYYTWGIDWSLPPGEIIDAAWLEIKNIRNWRDEPHVLWCNLLLTAEPVGVTSWPDYSGDLNQFDGNGIELFHWDDLWNSGVGVDRTHDFTDAEIKYLAERIAANGHFAFGFDPDCHFYNDGITFTIKTTHAPIPGAFWLLTSGLIGLVGIRQRTGRR